MESEVRERVQGMRAIADDLERALRGMPVGSEEVKSKGQQLVAQIRAIRDDTPLNVIEHIAGEINNFLSSLSPLRSAGSTMRGMEVRPDAQPTNERMQRAEQELRHIQAEIARIHASRNTTPPAQHRALFEQLQRLDEQRHQILLQNLPPEQFIRNLREKINSAFRPILDSQAQHLPSILRRARTEEDLVREFGGFVDNVGMVGQVQQAIIDEWKKAYGSNPAALIGAGTGESQPPAPTPRNTDDVAAPGPAGVNSRGGAAPGAGTPGVVDAQAPAAPAADGGSGAVPQAGGTGPARAPDAARGVSSDPPLPSNLQDALREIQKLREEKKAGVSIVFNGIGTGNAVGGGSVVGGGFPGGAGVMPGVSQQPQAPGRDSLDALARGGVQDEGERKRLRAEHKRLDDAQEALVDQLVHVEDKKKREEIHAQYKALREQQKNVVRSLFGSDFYERLQAHRDAGGGAVPAHNPRQSTGFEGRDGQPAHVPNLTNAVHGNEGSPSHSAAPEEHAVAAQQLRTQNASRWDRHAQLIGSQNNLNVADVRRWMNAPKRWGYKLFSGAGAGLFGWVAKAVGTPWLSAIPTSALSASFPTLGAFSTGFTVLGATIPFSAAPIIAVALGIAAWKGVRRLADMHKNDALADAGWEARKVAKRMEKWDRRRERAGTRLGLAKIPGAYERVQRAEYEKVHNRWRIFRMHNLPTVIGSLLTGGVLEDIHSRGAVRSGLGTMGSNVQNSRFGSWASNWWQYISSGGPFSQGTMTECQTAVEELRLRSRWWLDAEEDLARARARLDVIEDDATRNGFRIADRVLNQRNAAAALEDMVSASNTFSGRQSTAAEALQNMAVEANNYQNAHLRDEATYPEDSAIPNAASPLPPQAPPVSAPEPLAPQVDPDIDGPSQAPQPQPAPPPQQAPGMIVELPRDPGPLVPQANPDIDGPSQAPQPQPAPPPQQAPGTVVEAPRRLLQPSDFRFEILEGGETPTIPQAFRRLLRESGFQGPVAEWFTDTVDKRTYYGIPGFKSGPSVLEMLTNQRGLIPTRIPDHALVDFARLFNDNAFTNDILNRINRSNVLTSTQRGEALRILEFLENSVRRSR